MDIKTSTMSFHVGFMCRYCELIFKSTHEFCTHKVEFHFTKLTKSRCIVFKESLVEPTDETELTNFGKVVAIVQAQPQFKNNFEDKPCVGEKQEASDPVFISETFETSTNLKIDNPVSLLALANGGNPKPGSNSDIKTEWMEETINKYEASQQNEDFITSHTNSVTHLYHNPLEPSDVTQSTESRSSSTFTADTEQEYLSKNQSNSDDDIICLDNDQLPSTTKKIASPTGPTATTTTVEINNSVFSQLELECEICSKQFSSSAQLGIHVGICKLYNSRKTGAAAASTEPVRKNILALKCQECFRLIKGSNFQKHMNNHEARAYDKARRAFVCQICATAFGSKDNLEKHAGVHSDETPNRCTFPGCHSAFKYRSGLLNHFKNTRVQTTRCA